MGYGRHNCAKQACRAVGPRRIEYMARDHRACGTARLEHEIKKTDDGTDSSETEQLRSEQGEQQVHAGDGQAKDDSTNKKGPYGIVGE